jgi:hypothetical protein
MNPLQGVVIHEENCAVEGWDDAGRTPPSGSPICNGCGAARAASAGSPLHP